MAKRATIPARPGSNQPPKIIVKKIIAAPVVHHGGAWKVAYADFVTAMMAFFLLMWLLGATTEKQRRAIADYFSPTLVATKRESAGANGLLGGASLTDKDAYPFKAAQTGTRAMTVPLDAQGGPDSGGGSQLRSQDMKSFQALKKRLERQFAANAGLRKAARQVRFVPTREGLRIDLIDSHDYSMFALGTTALNPEAAELIGTVAQAIKPLPNQVSIRGHTDSLPFGDPRQMNNWTLSTGRAEATRRRLALGGVLEPRFERIEGVADRDPFVGTDLTDPRNRRVSITLLYRGLRG